MKAFFVNAALLFALAGFQACAGDDSKTAELLEKKQQELESKKQELADKKQIQAVEQELQQVNSEIQKVEGGKSAATTVPATHEAPAPAFDSNLGQPGQITGSGVVMRQNPSVKAEKVANFNVLENIIILETKNVNNENEAILTKNISLYADSKGAGTAAMTLNKGKAVVLESYDADKNKHYVSYQDPQKGKLYAYVSSDAIETISYSTWYKVRRSNRQEGWVLGKFVKAN